jgi:hypothetical protein
VSGRGHENGRSARFRGSAGAADGVDKGARGRGRSTVECGFRESRGSHGPPSMEIVGGMDGLGLGSRRGGDLGAEEEISRTGNSSVWEWIASWRRSRQGVNRGGPCDEKWIAVGARIAVERTRGEMGRGRASPVKVWTHTIESYIYMAGIMGALGFQ